MPKVTLLSHFLVKILSLGRLQAKKKKEGKPKAFLFLKPKPLLELLFDQSHFAPYVYCLGDFGDYQGRYFNLIVFCSNLKLKVEL